MHSETGSLPGSALPPAFWGFSPRYHIRGCHFSEFCRRIAVESGLWQRHVFLIGLLEGRIPILFHYAFKDNL